MTVYNIKIKKRNGDDWDTILPISTTQNIKLEDGTSVQNFIDNVYNNLATSSNNGAMSKEDKTKLDTVAENANDYVHPSGPNVRHVTDNQISIWNDKYTKTEVDNLLQALHSGMDWKESVKNFSDISIIYPNPQEGWTVSTKDTNITYRFDGKEWIAISSNSIPLASESVDGKMSKEDKKSLDNLIVNFNSLSTNFNVLNSFANSNINSIKNSLTTDEATINTNKIDISNLKKDKSDINHNHDGVYSGIHHNHDSVYSNINHNHDSKYVLKKDGIINSNLNIQKNGDKEIDFRNTDGAVVASIKSNDDGNIFINSTQGKNVVIRTYGEDNSENQFVISPNNVFFNGRSLIAGNGFVGSIGNVLFDLDQETGKLKVIPFDRGKGDDVAKNDTYLRNDNTWHKIIPSDIDAANKIHTHSIKDIVDFKSAGNGEMLIGNNEGNLVSTKLVKGYDAICRELSRLEFYKTACLNKNVKTIVCIENSTLYTYENNTWVSSIIKNIYQYFGVGTIIRDTISKSVLYVDTSSIIPIVDIYFSGSIKYKVDANLINQTPQYRLVSDAEKAIWSGKASTTLATTNNNGLMSKADKIKLDSLSNGNNLVKKYCQSIGDSSNTTFRITHNLNTDDTVVTVKDANTKEMVLADVIFTDNNNITIKFKNAPTTNQYKVVVIG